MTEWKLAQEELLDVKSFAMSETSEHFWKLESSAIPYFYLKIFFLQLEYFHEF